MPFEPPPSSGGGFVAFGGDSVDGEGFLISGAEAAAIAGVGEAAIRQLATRRKIKRFPGRRRCDGTFYARPEIEAYAERRRARLSVAA